MLNIFWLNILIIILLLPSIILYICLKYLANKFNFDFKIIGPFSYSDIIFNYEDDLFSINFKIDKFSLNLIWLKFRFIIKGFKLSLKLKEKEKDKKKEKPIELFNKKDIDRNKNKDGYKLITNDSNLLDFNIQEKKGKTYLYFNQKNLLNSFFSKFF